MVGLFFDAKASREERWLMVRFPEYAAYRRQVPKLVPFLYEPPVAPAWAVR